MTDTVTIPAIEYARLLAAVDAAREVLALREPCYLADLRVLRARVDAYDRTETEET